MEYCWQCGEFPCSRYQEVPEYDSFITKGRRIQDLERCRRMGPGAYGAEQAERRRLLDLFLERWNDGRRKTLFALAANLLEIGDLEAAAEQLEAEGCQRDKLGAARAAQLLQKAAQCRGIQLKLRRNPEKSKK